MKKKIALSLTLFLGKRILLNFGGVDYKSTILSLIINAWFSIRDIIPMDNGQLLMTLSKK